MDILFFRGLLKSGFKAVSLGSWCGLRGCLQEMGLHEESYPFDNMRISLEGVMHFLDARFHNFLKYERCSEMGQNEGRRLYHCKYHSFWHDNLDDPVDRAKYERRTARFLKLHEAAKQLLFVYACNSSSEVDKGEQLLHSLFRLFGEDKVWLLVLVGCQNEERSWEVAGTSGRLLVHATVARENGPGYRQGVTMAARRVALGQGALETVAACKSLGWCLRDYMVKDPRWCQYAITNNNDELLDEVEGGQGTIWRVVAGGDKGIVVRSGRQLRSQELPRLSKGARVEEVELKGERLHYRRLEGSGPDWGWVSLTLNGARLLRPEGQASLKKMKRVLWKNKVVRLLRAWQVAVRVSPV